MNQDTVKAIKTIAGGIFHSIICNNIKEFEGRDWELLCSHFKIDPDTIHSFAVIPNGFILFTRTFTLRYVHDGYSVDKRKIDIQFINTAI